MYAMKQRFYHGKDWNECLPKASISGLRRMLLIGHGVLCAIDELMLLQEWAYWRIM